MTERWDDVAIAVERAVGYAFDGCHKIYVLLDEPQFALMRTYGYGEDESYLVRASEDADYDVELLRSWYDDSCGLRFINAVRTVPGNPNDGFTDLIPQFADEEEDDDE